MDQRKAGVGSTLGSRDLTGYSKIGHDAKKCFFLRIEGIAFASAPTVLGFCKPTWPVRGGSEPSERGFKGEGDGGAANPLDQTHRLRKTLIGGLHCVHERSVAALRGYDWDRVGSRLAALSGKRHCSFGEWLPEQETNRKQRQQGRCSRGKLFQRNKGCSRLSPPPCRVAITMVSSLSKVGWGCLSSFGHFA